MTTSREQIIATTCELLELQGYHATGLNDIITASGSPKGSLYYYFPGGKEALAIEAVAHVGRVVLERIHQNLAEITPAADAIEAFLLRIAEQIEASEYRAGGPITTVAMEAAATSERLRKECQRIYEDWANAFADTLLKDGFSPENARAIAIVIISAIEGAVLLCRTSRSTAPMEQVAQAMAKLVRCARE